MTEDKKQLSKRLESARVETLTYEWAKHLIDAANMMTHYVSIKTKWQVSK